MEEKYSYLEKGMSMNIPSFSLRMIFITIFRNSWEDPCISHATVIVYYFLFLENVLTGHVWTYWSRLNSPNNEFASR